MSTHSPILDRRRARHRVAWMAGGLFGLALVLRVACVLELRRDVLFDYPVIDQHDYVVWGRLIAANGYSEPQPFPRPPGTPYALALVFELAGPGLLAPRLVQAVLSAAVCVLIFLAGRAWFSTGVALATGLVTALHGVHIHAATELMPTTWIVFLDMLALACLVWAGRSRAAGGALASGVVIGLSAVFLPVILLFAPVACWWLWTRARQHDAVSPPSGRKIATGRSRALAFVCGMVLVLLPVAVRNAVVGHDGVLVASNDGINFFLGNNADYERTVAIRPGRDYQDLEWEPIARGAAKPSQQSAFFFRKSLAFMARHPLRAAGLELRKLYLFFDGVEIPRSSDIYLARAKSGVLRALVWPGPLYFPNGLVMPLALLGIAGGWSQRRRWWLLFGFAVTQMIGVCLFLVSSRYRVPSLPVWTLFACAGVVWFAHAMRAEPWKRRILVVATLAAMLVVFNRATSESRLDLRGEEAYYRAEGAFELGRKQQARAEVDRALELEPRNTDAWKLLGMLRSQAGDDAGALAAWRRVMALDPLDVDASRRIAYELEKKGDVEGALAVLQANLAHVDDPRAYANDYSQDMLRMAQLYERQGKRERALAMVRDAVQFNPENADAVRMRADLERRHAPPVVRP